MTTRCVVFSAACCCATVLFLSARARAVEPEYVSSDQPQRPDEIPLIVSMPEPFQDLERAPVTFYHDTHVRALENEGCEACHPDDGQGVFTFSYPKERPDDDRDKLMNAFHDDCTGCHTTRRAEGKKAGPVTCGECHVIADHYRGHEYLPVLPQYYEPLRDTYHRDCIACHQDPAKSAEDAGGLDWKRFYIQEKERTDTARPDVYFDYVIHSKHTDALDSECEHCHYLSPERTRQIAAEDREPTCREWLLQQEPDNPLMEQDAAHKRCINCHLKNNKEGKTAGPYFCSECHTEGTSTASEMTAAPRQECDLKDTILILVEEGARADGVPFNHASHVSATSACQDCHHDTLEPCKTCHTLTGDPDGDGITLAEAFHEPESAWSCIGCHNAEKRKSDCAGCHHLMETGLVGSACASCHSGSLEYLDRPSRIVPPHDLIPDDVEDEWKIIVLENEYGPSTFPHRAIAQRLTDISNESKLATHFHEDSMTVCAGCHHLGPLSRKKTAPLCSSCHTTRNEPERAVPTLLGAYHQQCLGCHRHMGAPEEQMPQSCSGCHEENKPDNHIQKSTQP